MKKSLFRRLLLPVIGLAGIGYGVVYAISLTHVAKVAEVAVSTPPTSNFSRSISGSGLIEANTRNIEVGSHQSGIVTELLVNEGDVVALGAPLFRLDARTAEADIATAESNLSVAKAQLAEAQVSLADQQDQVSRVKGLKEGFAVTGDRVARLHFAERTAGMRLNVAKATVEEAQARLDAAKTTREKLTVTAPIAGRILKLNARVGQFVLAGQTNPVPLVMGNDTPLHVRVSVDENDVWRFNKEAKATAAPRSNRNVTLPLTFVRLEPIVVPKTSLTGATSERVDTRVLEVVYRIDMPDAPVYIGQQVDVFIDAATAAPPAPAPVAAAAAEAVTQAPAPASQALPVAAPAPAEPAVPLPVLPAPVPAAQ